MKSIGGYHSLELPYRNGYYHKSGVLVNTARNALEYIIKANKIRKIYLPFLMCEVLLEPINKLKIDYEFYEVNHAFEPVFNYSKIEEQEALLYINYFGINDSIIDNILKISTRIIVDNSQSFFSPIREKCIGTFYSPRKFFGVPDGGILYTNELLSDQLEKDISNDRMIHLVKRIEEGAENAYQDFIESELSLCNQPIKLMSDLTERILKSLPYEKYSSIRMSNFAFLEENLGSFNKIQFSDSLFAPLVYPFWVENGNEIRERLIKRKIYIAKYWDYVLKFENNLKEKELVNNIVAIPIDHRYNTRDMLKIISSLN